MAKTRERAIATASAEPEEGAERKTLETWNAEKRTDAADFVGACVKNGWGIGMLLTEKQYDDGINAFRQIGMRLWRYRARKRPSGARASGS